MTGSIGSSSLRGLTANDLASMRQGVTYSSLLDYNPYYPLARDGSLVAAYDFRTLTSGGLFADLGQNGYNLTPVGGVTMQDDGALFDGSTGYAYYAGNGGLIASIPAAFTLEVEFRCATSGDPQQNVCSFLDSNSVYLGQTGAWRSEVWDTAARQSFPADPPKLQNVPRTYVIRAVPGDIIRTFVDGQAVDRAPPSPVLGTLGRVGSALSDIVVASRAQPSTPSLFFNGKVRRLRIWGRGLTDAEVRSISLRPSSALIPYDGDEWTESLSGPRHLWSPGSGASNLRVDTAQEQVGSGCIAVDYSTGSVVFLSLGLRESIDIRQLRYLRFKALSTQAWNGDAAYIIDSKNNSCGFSRPALNPGAWTDFVIDTQRPVAGGAGLRLFDPSMVVGINWGIGSVPTPGTVFIDNLRFSAT